MGRRRKKQKQKTKIITVQVPISKDHQLWWNLFGLLLTLITGIIIPFYFQYESNQFQLTETRSLSTIQAFQPTANTDISQSDSLEYLLSSLDTSIPKPTNGTSAIRLVDVSADIGCADLFVDGLHLLSNFQFGATTPYVTLSPGPHLVVVALVGRGPYAEATNQNIAVVSGDVYTVATLSTKSRGFKVVIFNNS
jgi:hypothetical protein